MPRTNRPITSPIRPRKILTDATKTLVAPRIRCRTLEQAIYRDGICGQFQTPEYDRLALTFCLRHGTLKHIYVVRSATLAQGQTAILSLHPTRDSQRLQVSRDGRGVLTPHVHCVRAPETSNRAVQGAIFQIDRRQIPKPKSLTLAILYGAIQPQRLREIRASPSPVSRRKAK